MIVFLFIILWASIASAFDVDVTRVALNTSIGTQNITFSNFDEDCTAVTCAAIFYASTGVTDGTSAAHALRIVGFTDGTNDRVSSSVVDDNLGTTDANRRIVADALLRDADATMKASFSSWLSNGIQINITDAPPAAWLTTVVIIGGSGISVDVDNFTSNASVDGTTDVTAPGFNPDIVFLSGVRVASIPEAATSALFTFGVAVDDGSDTQGSIGCYSEDNVGTTNPHAATSSLYAAQFVDSAGLDLAILVDGWDANGFTATTKVSGVARTFAYLALALGGPDSAVIDIDTPTATGSDSETIGFTSLFGIMLGTLAQAYDTDEADSDGGNCMASFFTADEQYSISGGDEDGVTTSNTFSLSNDQIVTLEQDDGSCSAGSCFQATLTSIDSSGWNLNYSFTFTDAARKWIGFAIEDTTAGRRRGPGVIQ